MARPKNSFFVVQIKLTSPRLNRKQLNTLIFNIFFNVDYVINKIVFCFIKTVQIYNNIFLYANFLATFFNIFLIFFINLSTTI